MSITATVSKVRQEKDMRLSGIHKKPQELLGEAQRCLEVEVKVVPAQPAFPACWADRGRECQQRETGRRQPQETNRKQQAT